MEKTGFECPKCGADLMENDFLYACEKENAEEDKCEFKLWKKNKLLGEEIDELIFQSLNSEEGYAFDRGVMRIDPNAAPFFTSIEWNNNGGGGGNFEVNLDFHLLEITTKDGRKLKIWKEQINTPEENAGRKTVFQEFCGHEITEEEAQKLFNGETIAFENLKSKKGSSFSANAKLEYEEERQNWNLKLLFD